MKKIKKSDGFVSIAAFWVVEAAIWFFCQRQVCVNFGAASAAVLTLLVLSGINWSGGRDHFRAP